MSSRFVVFLALLAATAQGAPEGLTDPTRPLSAPVAVALTGSEQVQLKLQQIIERGNQRFALIDGHLLQENQALGEYWVRSIGTTQVVMEKRDSSLVTLALFGAFKKN